MRIARRLLRGVGRRAGIVFAEPGVDERQQRRRREQHAEPRRRIPARQLRLDPFGNERGPVQTYMDLRVGKTFKVGERRLEASVDAINALNTNVAQSTTYLSGPTYGQIVLIPAPRIVRFGIQYSF